jgi:hypothetical protein
MKTQSINCDFQVERVIDYGSDQDIFLPPNEEFELQIDYPCDRTLFHIQTGANGMGTLRLVKEIGKSYQKIYKDADTTNPYNVWGHDVGDLVIERISVDYVSKKIKLAVGS